MGTTPKVINKNITTRFILLKVKKVPLSIVFREAFKNMSQRKNIILKKNRNQSESIYIYFLEFSHFRADKTLIFLYDLSLLGCLAKSDKKRQKFILVKVILIHVKQQQPQYNRQPPFVKKNTTICDVLDTYAKSPPT